MAALTAGQLAALDSTAKGKCWNQIVQTLIDLGLTGPGGRWYVARVPHLSAIHDSGVSYPLGCVSDWRGSMNDSGGATNLAQTSFKFIIGLARGSNFDLQNDIDKTLEWDQEIRRAFRKKNPTWLSAVANARMNKVTVTEGETFIPEDFRKGVDAMYYLVEVTIAEALT